MLPGVSKGLSWTPGKYFGSGSHTQICRGRIVRAIMWWHMEKGRVEKMGRRNFTAQAIETPTLQKSEGFRVKAPEGEVVVLYFELSATQNLKSSGFPSG